MARTGAAPPTEPLAQNDPLALAEDLGRLIGVARRRVWQTANERLEAAGETVFSWQLLVHIVRRGGSSQRDLACLTAQHPAGVSRTLDEMEARGVVRRERDPDDRRRQIVRATARGEARLRQIHPLVVASIDEVFSPLSEPDRRRLRALLQRVAVEDDPANSIAAPAGPSAPAASGHTAARRTRLV